MNSTHRRRSRRPARRTVNLAPELIWHHLGQGHRVTLWPEVAFEKEITPGLWRPFTPDPRTDAFCAGAVMVEARRWKPYLEFCPVEWVNLIEQFEFHRLHVLTALAYCPTMQSDFEACPALALFAAMHAELRGGLPDWCELNAVREHSGVFGVLEWLGFPSTRECLDQLGAIDLSLSVRELVKVREILWKQHDCSVAEKTASHQHNPLAA